MKHKKSWIFLTLVLAAIFVFAACTSPEPMTADDDMAAETEMEAEPMEEAEAEESETSEMESESEAMEEEAMDDSAAMPMTDDEMIALITEKLDGKHDIDRVLNGDKTREEWEETIDRMIGYGAKINEEEKTLIIDWLLNR